MRRHLVALLACLLAALTLVAAPPAAAHVELIEAEPAVEGEATEGQTTVTLTLAAFDTDRPVDVEVTDPSGSDVTTGEASVDPRRSTIEVATRPLEVGQHIVRWQASADDGDESEGSYTFTVVDAPGGGFGIWLIWLLALGIPAAIFLRPGARRAR